MEASLGPSNVELVVWNRNRLIVSSFSRYVFLFGPFSPRPKKKRPDKGRKNEACKVEKPVSTFVRWKGKRDPHLSVSKISWLDSLNIYHIFLYFLSAFFSTSTSLNADAQAYWIVYWREGNGREEGRKDCNRPLSQVRQYKFIFTNSSPGAFESGYRNQKEKGKKSKEFVSVTQLNPAYRHNRKH